MQLVALLNKLAHSYHHCFSGLHMCVFIKRQSGEQFY